MWLVQIVTSLLVICCQVLSASRENATVVVVQEGPEVALSKSSLLATVKAFTSYHIYFKTNHSPFLDAVCIRYPVFNESSRLLEDAVQACPRPNFDLRQVSRSQITWKPSQNTNKTSNHKDKGNSTTSDTLPSNEEKKDNSSDKVHSYLVFALLLPDHPFSRDVKHWIKLVAPMFPCITFIVGNAYEFKDVSSKYLVHNFPKILLFKKGIYVGDYGESYDPASLASYFSLWTKQLPKTIPLPISKPQALSSVAFLQLPKRDDISFLKGMDLSFLQSFDLSFLERIPIPAPNLEPFIGTLENFQFWDRFFFLVCGVYFFARLSHLYI